MAVEPSKIILIYIDKRFGANDLVEIDNAINQWNYSLNGYIKLQVADYHFEITDMVPIDGWSFIKVDKDDPSIPGNNTYAYCNRVGGSFMYLIRDRLFSIDVKPVTMHEIGHLLGSAHVNNSSSLMYPYYAPGGFACIDLETINNIAKYQHISTLGLNYCLPNL